MREAGFTLIETALALALLAFIVADVGMVAIQASRGGVEAQRITSAVALAENAIEHTRGADFNRIRLADSGDALCFRADRTAVDCGDPTVQIVRACFGVTLARVPCGGAGVVFTRERNVTTPGGVGLAEALCADVDVLVTWVDARGRAQEFRLASTVSKF